MKPEIGTEFFFAGVGTAGADTRGFDLGFVDGDFERDKGLDTRFGILRRGENAVSGYGSSNGRTVRFDVDIQGNDPFGDNDVVPALERESKMNALDSGAGYLFEGAGETCIFGLTQGKTPDVTDPNLYSTRGPSVAYYREWICRTMELDMYLVELRSFAEEAKEIALPIYPGASDILTKMETGFGKIYAAEGAVAHRDATPGSDLVLPATPATTEARFQLEADAVGDFLQAASLAFSDELIALEDELGYVEEVAAVQDSVYAAAELCLYDIAMISHEAAVATEGADPTEIAAAEALLNEADAHLWSWETREGLEATQAALTHLAQAVARTSGS